MIKQAGAILFSFLLLHAQVFALKGGPWDNVRNIYGTYSAIMVPDAAANIEEINEAIEESNNSDNDPSNDEELLTEEDDPSANSLGLIVLVVTPEGFAEGWNVLFVEGLALTGPVVALGDPDSGELSGILAPTVPLVAVVTTSTGTEEVEYLGSAHGHFKAKLIEQQDRKNGQSLQRIEGTAYTLVDLSLFGAGIAVNFFIDGYRSSSNTDVGSLTIPDFGEDA